ncbi:MAG: polyprenyl synthetase family protein, partial [Candidatus Scalindua sp.]
GQDRDIAGITHSEEEYWLTVELKSAYVYATACETGAIVGTENNTYINSCRAFGRHLGRSMQILNDMESIWLSKGKSDLEQNKVTLPVLYGLSVDHPAKTELETIVNSSRLAVETNRVVEILNSIDTKKYLYWAALKERDEALEALAICPDPEGKEALEAYVTGMFGDIDTLVSSTEIGRK